jgi:hypothetical protein
LRRSQRGGDGHLLVRWAGGRRDRAEAELPVLRVGAAMAEAAVRLGRPIGLLGIRQHAIEYGALATHQFALAS